MCMEQQNTRCYLVKTLPELAEKSVVGVGWSDHNFAELCDAETVIKEVDKDYGIGRWGNQIRRFFRINDGDVIVVPLQGSLMIGRSSGAIFFDADYKDRDRANQRNVDFPKDKNGKNVRIPREEFSERFQRRLRVRGMTINDLTEFKTELLAALESVEKGKYFTWENRISNEAYHLELEFKRKLFENICNGKTNLKAGGIGLENLVEELLELDGYEAKILSKRTFQGYADADIKASKVDKIVNIDLLIQVKHHYGYSGEYGINQLLEIRKYVDSSYSNYQMVFITSALVTEELLKYAHKENVKVIDGRELVDWITEKIDELSIESKAILGICEAPRLVELE